MGTDVDLRVAGTVRAEMARCRLSQTALAQALGISQAHVSRKVRGLSSFTVAELDVIAGLVGLPASLLISEPLRSVS